MKLAIFGGTFDPIHCAHLKVARESVRQFALDRVLFIPASHPPHKGGVTCAPFEDRFRMVELACEGEPKFVPSGLEAGRRKSFSIRTIEKVRATLAREDELFFLIGADAFAEVQSWYRWQDVIREVKFIVVTRPGHSYETPPGAEVRRLESLALPVSSSEIRAKLQAGETPPEVPPRVLGYIREHRLYTRRPEEASAKSEPPRCGC